MYEYDEPDSTPLNPEAELQQLRILHIQTLRIKPISLFHERYIPFSLIKLPPLPIRFGPMPILLFLQNTDRNVHFSITN